MVPLFCLIGVIVAIATTQYGYLAPVAILYLIFVRWSFNRPVVAVSVIVLAHLAILEKSEGITPAEILFGLYFFGYLSYWGACKLIRRQPILTSPPDYFLLLFLLLCCFSVAIGLFDNASLFKGFREVLTVFSLLLYFPARDAMKMYRHRRIVLGAFLLMVMVFAFKNLLNWSVGAAAATYLWELLGSRTPANAHFFFALSVVSMALIIHARKLSIRLCFLITLLISAAALITSFARGFWLGTLAGLVIMFILLDSRGKGRLLLYSFAGALLLGVIVLLSAPALAQSFLAAIISRLASSGNPLEDMSVATRLAESKAVLVSIPVSPIVGHGFGSTFSYYNPLDHMTVETWYAHNGYLFLIFKVGLAGLFLFLGFYISVARIAWRELRRFTKADPEAGLEQGILATLLAMLLIAVSSNVFIEKQSLLIISLGAAFVLSRSRDPEASLSSQALGENSRPS